MIPGSVPRCLPACIAVALLIGAPAVALASCVGTPLTGLDPTGQADNTLAIQTAIDQKAAAGGGAVVLNPGRYLMTGTLQVRRAVVLCGAAHGPFDPGGANPVTTTIAPTFLITNTMAPFITLADFDASVTDLLFHYPNQVLPTATAPIPYPFTIVARMGNHRVERCTTTNAYRFLDLQTGRITARDLLISAFFVGIHIDHALDHITLSNIIHSVMWDLGFTFPQPIDTWVMNNGTAFVIKRVDGVSVDNVLVFWRHTAFHLTDSEDPAQFRRMGYGSLTNLDIDSCMYAVRARSTDPRGFKFSNIDIGCGTPSGPAAWGVAQEPAGTSPPVVMINGGFIGGVWGGGLFQRFTGGGKMIAVHVLGYDE